MTLGTHFGDTLEEDWCGARMVWSSHGTMAYHEMFHSLGFDMVMEEFEGRVGDIEYHRWVLLRKRS